MLDRIRSFSNSSHPQTTQRIERAPHARFSSEASSTSGSESSSSNPGSTARMLTNPPFGGKAGEGAGGRVSFSSTIQRGRDTMGVCASSSTAIRLNTIADIRLRSAAERFLSFRSKLRALDGALRSHHADLVRAERSRSALAEALADAGRGTPLHELMGRTPDPLDETSESGLRSYAAILGDVTSSVLPRLDKYREETLVYVTEWEKTISTRIATELRHVRRLHSNFVKYHRKVESLRNAAAKKKGGPSDGELAKIERNESKLRTATKDYRRNLVAVTLLTEEVTDRGWKDLIPLVLMLIEHDVETTSRTAEIIDSKLTTVREETKELGRRYEMDYAGMTAGRLRVLLEEDATEFVSPEDMADIESIMPSIGTASVGTSTPGTFTRGVSSRPGSSPAAAIPPAIQENPAAEQERGASAAEIKAVATPPCSDKGDSDENDDQLSLDRPEPEGSGPPEQGPKSPSAPPVDLMSAVSRGKDIAQQEADQQRRAREALAAALPPVLQNRQQAAPPLPSGHPGAPSPVDADDEQSKINYPSSIYFANANYSDDVTALTPYPDLVSI